MKKQTFSRFLALVLTALMLVGAMPIAVWADASDFSYYISTNADGEYAVIDSYHGDGGTVVVPAEIDGLPVLQIAYGVFGSCEGITHVTFSEGIRVLSGNVFAYSSVQTVTLPSTLTTISAQCFVYSDLTEITIPESVTMVGSGVFEGCEYLTDVYLEAKEPGENWDERWADNCHANLWYDGVMVAACVQDDIFFYRVQNRQATVLEYIGDYYTKCVVVPELVGDAAVTAIGADAFKDKYYIQEIVLPETVTVIANNAFISCGSLEKINLPLGLTHIGMQAFMWCGNLQELSIPENVTYIGSNAFYNDYATLYFEADAAPESWDSDWAEYFYGTSVWGACMHRDVTVDGVEKTCETDGYRRVTCNGCDKEISYEFFALGHEYVYGICSVCGSAKDTWEDFFYYFDYFFGEDGTETYGIVIGGYDGEEQYVLIPSEIDGYPVIGIGDSVFNENRTILGVQVPSSVKFIGNWAFASSTLRTAELSEGLERISGCAFMNTPLQMINFPSTLKTIDDCAFVQTKLYRIEIPEGVTYVGNQAFDGCTSLTEIRCGAEAQPEGWNEHWDQNVTANVYFAGRLAVFYYTENSTVYRIDIATDDAADGVATLYDYNGSETVVEIPAYVGDWPVVKIGYEAFWYRDVTSVTIPDTVTEIAVSAFASCYSLTEINIPDSVTAIGNNAFSFCYALTEITIPASVETMDYSVFYECSGLQNIYCEAASQPDTWNESWTNSCEANIWFDGVMFSGVSDGYRFEIADGGVIIKDYLGEDTELTVPSEINGYPVTEIAPHALGYLYDVTSITLPDTLVAIGEYAFDESSLTEITIPASVETMGTGVFWNCYSLQNIYCEAASMPETWNEYWFSECSANVWFDGRLVRGLVDGYLFETADGKAIIMDYIGEETELVVPAELAGCPVTEIAAFAFADLYGVTSITLPKGVTHIGVHAFADSGSLTEVYIPESVIHIGSYAFAWCYALTEITIPASVESMGSYVFMQCDELTDIYCEAASQPEGWESEWASCNANVWFGGVLVRGTVDGYVFETADGKAIIKTYVGEETDLIIPSEISGVPVTAIGTQAFSGRDSITSVIIPEGVTNIGGYAFAWCYALTEVTIPASAAEVSNDVFLECYALQNIYCKAASQPDTWNYSWAEGCNANIWFDGVLTQGTIDGFVFKSENGNVTIRDYVGEATEIVIPATLGGMPVVMIGSNAFSELYDVTSIVIPDGVERIYYEAFAWCDSLTEITIPASVTVMSDDIFWECGSLQNIYCEAASQPADWSYGWTNGCNACVYFDGVLTQGVWEGFKFMTSDGTVGILDYVGDATEIVIPAEIGGMPVMGIESHAFADLHDATSITIPDTVFFIGSYAFAWCYALTEITIPESVTQMRYDVFWDCNNLENIYCEAAFRPDTWDGGWANGCDASIWFDGVLTVGYADGYKISTSDGKVTILGYAGDATEIEIPAEIDGLPVTCIGNQAFANLYEVTSIRIPDSVTDIESYAFAWCYALTEITIPDSVTFIGYDAFWDCGNLQNIYCEAVSQPDAWDSGWNSGCNATVWFDGVLTQGVIDGFRITAVDGEVVIMRYVGEESVVVIPSELAGLPVTQIAYEAFAYNEMINEVTIPASVLWVDDNIFYGSYNLQNIYCEASKQPDGWSGYWYNECSASVFFDGVLTVGVVGDYRIKVIDGEVSVLRYLGSAESAEIPAEMSGMPVTRIEADAFDSCDWITSVTIPDSVTFIGYEAFAYCYGLTEITIPASVLEIHGDVFWYCENLQNIYCEASGQPEEWDGMWSNGCNASIWFDGVLTRGVVDGFQIETVDGVIVIDKYLGYEANVVVPAEFFGLPVAQIASYAFSSNGSLVSVTLPDTIKEIGSRAFSSCLYLETINIPEGVEAIGARAFWDCGSLTEITVPASVVSMGARVFTYCYELENIYCEASKQPDGWNNNWALECDANIWFDGVLTVGVIDGFRIETVDGEITILDYVGSAETVEIPAEIGGLPVTGIGYQAFAYCYGLTEITIPASVVWVETDAFYGCDALQNIYCEAASVPEGWSSEWLAGCDANIWFDGVLKQGVVGDYRIVVDNLNRIIILDYLGEETEIVIPAEIGGMPVFEIGYGAFSECAATSITISDGVVNIGTRAFEWCGNLTELTLPASVQSVFSEAFYGCYNLENIYCDESADLSLWVSDAMKECPANVWVGDTLAIGTIDGYRVEIRDGEAILLGYVGEETELIVPAELGGVPVTTVRSYAFANRGGMTGIVLPSSVKVIESGAFIGNSSLQTVQLSEGLEFIGSSAFTECHNLTEITIPASVTELGGWVFENCGSLQNIYCKTDSQPDTWNSNWVLGCDASIWFNGVLSRGVVDGFYVRLQMDTYTIYGYEGEAVNLVIPAEIGGIPVTSIATSAFAGCDWIESVTLSENITDIGYEAFAYCHGLTEITIPKGVLAVDSDAFWYCENLQNIYCEASERPEDWSTGWANGCDANIWFDGVLKIGYVGDYRVEITADGVTVLSYRGADTDVVIPDTIMDLPVTAIGDRAFSDCSDIGMIKIPESVVYIGDRAFYGCDGLTEVTIPENVEYVGYRVFGSCDALEKIYCEAAEQPADWNSDWKEECYASIWFDGVLKVGVVDGFRYELYDGEASILGYRGGETGELVIPAELAGYPVTMIGYYAFVECAFESVVIPDSVVYIGYEAFAHCYELTEITIPESVVWMDSDVFWDCINLQNIYCEAAEQPENWADGWLNECYANVWFDGVLKRGVVGDYRISIEDENNVTILAYLGGDTDIVIPAEINGIPVTAIGQRAFYDRNGIQSVVIPDSVTYIGGYAFAWCYDLTELTVPASVAYVDECAFAWCENLQNLYLETGIDTSLWNESWYEGIFANIWLGDTPMTGNVGDYFVFVDNGNATILGYYGSESNLVIPETLGGNTVRVIGASAFSANGTIETLVLPDTVVAIRSGAFYNCYNLQSVKLPSGLEYIGARAFAECYNLTGITIPGSVLYIADEAFVYCESLRTVILSEGVEELGYAAFAACFSLQGIVLPTTLLAIDSFCFAETSLTQITIPLGVVYIGEGAFAYNSELETVYCEAAQMPDGWDEYWLYDCEAEVVWGAVPCKHQNLMSEVIKEPTCEEDGYERVFCADCGMFLLEGPMSARGHSYDENGICVDCGAEQPVADVVYGDINDDGKINGRDVTRLLQYLANYDPDTETSSVTVGEGADSNGDGKINGRDVTRLLQYLANYDPDTESSTVTLGPSK